MFPRLKSLELHGYKTFANRTLFEFPGMVTAVVGPNGSGKSNIADALRWVLGEQSYSVLRGKKTEDMIFAGSEQRPRAGMASATITFDNSDGWLPVDFVEVAITRRAYRDGQNEYLLNGQRVRLKEISELLAQCGLAERTYTVIGQGLVDAALALKPEERRRLFEEAAGIGLYRARKEEALRRLDSTQHNLERVQDILAEIEPRLQSLEKQARRVQEYERIKAELRVLLREWYGYHWFKAQKELNQVLEILKVQENRVELARKHQLDADQELANIRSRLQELRGQLNGLYTQSAQVNDQMQRVSRELAILNERQKYLIDSQRSLESDLTKAEEESTSFQENLRTITDEFDALKIDLNHCDSQAQNARNVLQENRKEVDKLEKSLRDARQDQTSTEVQQVQIKARQQELENRSQLLNSNITNLLPLITSSEQAVSKAHKQLMEAEKTRQSEVISLRAANDEMKACQEKTARIELERKNLSDQRFEFESASSRLQVQIKVLAQAEASYSGYSEGARFLLQSAHQDRLKGNYRALSSLMDVPAQYEIAIAAAMGEFLDLVLLDGIEEPEDVLRFLEREGRGRVALLPVDWAEPEEPIQVPDDPDCLGLAVDLIQEQHESSPLISLFLSSVLVMRNRAAARRILKGLPPRARAVTLHGEIFSHNGPVLAGQPGRSGTIGRKRELREFKTNLEESEQQIKLILQKITDTELVIGALRLEERNKAGLVRQTADQLDKASSNYQNAQIVLEKVERQAQWQAGQKEDLEKQIREVKDKLSQAAVEQSIVSTRLNDGKETIRQLTIELSGIPINELQSQVVYWETAFAVAARAFTDAEKRVSEAKQILDAIHQRQNLLTNRLKESSHSSAELVDTKKNLQTQEKQLAEQSQLLQKAIEPLSNELNGIEQQYEAQQQVEASAHQALSTSERYLTQAQLEYSRQRETTEGLRRRIEDDMGLVTFEYEANISGPTPLPFEGLVDQLPLVTELSSTIDESINRQRSQLRRIGAINLEAQSEYNSVRERYQFLSTQIADLRKADLSLRKVISELDVLMKRDFTKTYNEVAVEFRQMFSRLFGGGSAHLVLFDEENPQDSGIEIEARLPGRREQGLSLLSGGERSLTATALVFALLKVSPTPFCVMDEVDAMLDEANVGRFIGLLRELGKETQFIIITHNRNTVQAADVIYGVTMGRDSISQLISLKLDEIGEEMVN